MITKTQLLEMSDDNYMNDQQLSFFKDLLLKQKEELIFGIENAKKNLSESERNTDLNDIASSQEIQQLYLRTVDWQGKLLRKVNLALRSIDLGSYGYCKVNGEPIGVKRLLASPTATLSVEAKKIQEYQKRTQGVIKGKG